MLILLLRCCFFCDQVDVNNPVSDVSIADHCSLCSEDISLFLLMSN